MFRRITVLLATIAVSLTASAVLLAPVRAAAMPLPGLHTTAALDIRCSGAVTTGCIDCNNAAASSTVCKTTGQDPIGGRNGILYKVSVILSLVAGLGAVIVIVIGGFSYATAAGDPRKAGEARSMIIAAVIGLAVIAAGQTIITIVINAIK